MLWKVNFPLKKKVRQVTPDQTLISVCLSVYLSNAIEVIIKKKLFEKMLEEIFLNVNFKQFCLLDQYKILQLSRMLMNMQCRKPICLPRVQRFAPSCFVPTAPSRHSSAPSMGTSCSGFS